MARYIVFSVRVQQFGPGGIYVPPEWTPLDEIVEAETPQAAIEAKADTLRDSLVVAIPADAVTVAASKTTRTVSVEHQPDATAESLIAAEQAVRENHHPENSTLPAIPEPPRVG